jgi:hypothetical protein
MTRACLPMIVVLLLAAGVAATPAGAEDTASAAREWQSYCRPYLEAVDGRGEASDLEVTYCLGVTQGLMNGLGIGSQLGALSFGSRLAIQYRLDPDEVFKLFQATEPARLLGICRPREARTPDDVRAVLAYLEKNPDAAQRPIGEVFYEGLQAAYPCD